MKLKFMSSKSKKKAVTQPAEKKTARAPLQKSKTTQKMPKITVIHIEPGLRSNQLADETEKVAESKSVDTTSEVAPGRGEVLIDLTSFTCPLNASRFVLTATEETKSAERNTEDATGNVPTKEPVDAAVEVSCFMDQVCLGPNAPVPSVSNGQSVSPKDTTDSPTNKEVDTQAVDPSIDGEATSATLAAPSFYGDATYNTRAASFDGEATYVTRASVNRDKWWLEEIGEEIVHLYKSGVADTTRRIRQAANTIDKMAGVEGRDDDPSVLVDDSTVWTKDSQTVGTFYTKADDDATYFTRADDDATYVTKADDDAAFTKEWMDKVTELPKIPEEPANDQGSASGWSYAFPFVRSASLRLDKNEAVIRE